MLKPDRVILFSALAVLIAAYNLWPRLWEGAFYQGIAFGFLLLFLVLRRISKEERYIRAMATIGAWLAFNNVLDEIFFDPKKFGINEYIAACIVIFITCRRLWRTKTTKPGRFS
jgi:branched-subunit amino acid ABC-type transport system permease component